MRIYLDASVLVSFFSTDALTARADRFLRSGPADVFVSDFAAAEFASALSQRVRTRQLTTRAARQILDDFDAWTQRAAARTEIAPADVTTATLFLRRLDLTLRTADAINIAITQRVGATLATFDKRMAASASALGAAIAAI